jgi:hypothetical protein
VQLSAIEALSDFPPADAGPVLRFIVWQHPHAAARVAAVEAIADLPPAVGVPLLDTVISTHPDTAVVQEAIESVTQYAPRLATPILLRALRTTTSRCVTRPRPRCDDWATERERRGSRCAA